MLSIEVGSVYCHLANIRKKLNVHGNIELLQTFDTGGDVNMSTLRLTPRGREVFDLIMRGLTIAQIAERLEVSYSAILRHREKMLLQNNCHSMPELVAKYRSGPTGTDDGEPSS